MRYNSPHRPGPRAHALGIPLLPIRVGSKKELRAQARTAAVAAAREKAVLYTEAAGVRLGPVVHIQDVDSDQLQNVYRSHGQGGGAGGDGDLSPGKISVSAGVLIGFSIISG